MISEAIQPLVNDRKLLVSNLLGEIKSIEEFEDRNCIKVVCDKNYNAIYMSREPTLQPVLRHRKFRCKNRFV